MKTQVYSWRLSAGLKTELEHAARSRKLRVSAVLDMAARDWLARHARAIAGDDEQKRLHAIADQFIGAFSSGKPHDAKAVRDAIRKRLTRKYGSKHGR